VQSPISTKRYSCRGSKVFKQSHKPSPYRGTIMPYVTKARPYKKEYQQQLDRNELPTRRKREQARDLYDKEGIDRKGKDIDHKRPLSKGGSTAKGNLQLKAPSANRSFSRNSDHTVKVNKPKKK